MTTKNYMPPKWNRVVADAKAAGLIVTSDLCQIRVRRSIQGVGLNLCEDGTAYRCDIDLDLALQVRTEKEARKILGL